MGSNSPLFLPAVAYDSGGIYCGGTSNDSGSAFSRFVAVADLNGDGKPDLVATNCQNDTVGVLLGNGDGTFQAAVIYAAGGSESGPIAVADVNGDGHPDLVVGFSPGIGVLLGNGDGTFQSAVTYGSGGVEVLDVAIADVNRDGKPDLVVTNCGENGCSQGGTLAVLLGRGDGTFGSAVLYDSGEFEPSSIAVADVNGDGHPDLLVVDLMSKALAVVLGNGNGTFQAGVTYEPGGFGPPESLAVADVNGDGKPDLVVAECVDGSCTGGDGAVTVLLGNGDGTFRSAVAYDSGGGSNTGVAIADVDGDGKPDLIVANSYSSTVGVLLGNGDGTFQRAQTYGPGGIGPVLIVVADVNGDGKPDLVVGNVCDQSCDFEIVGVLLNNTGAPPTTTMLVSSLNPAPTGRAITYTATVKAQSGGAVTGSVMFHDSGLPLANVGLANNQAAYTTTYGPRAYGQHAITATYSGDVRNAGSTSTTLIEYVEGVASKTVVTTSGSPSIVGKPVTLTATVTSTNGGIPDGELVTFYDGTTPLRSMTLKGGTAAFTTSSLSAKTHNIKASYAGDRIFKPSNGFVTQIVDKHPTTTTLRSSLNPSAHGQAVTFISRVASAGPIPTGKVVFKDGTLGIGFATLSSGVAKLTKSALAVGTHPITAHYLGDAVSSESTSAVLNQVVK